jgi:hypothetical protein
MRSFDLSDLEPLPHPHDQGWGGELSVAPTGWSIFDAYSQQAEYVQLLEDELAYWRGRQAWRVGWRTFAGTVCIGLGGAGLVRAALDIAQWPIWELPLW